MRSSDWSSDVCSSDLRIGDDSSRIDLGDQRVEGQRPRLRRLFERLPEKRLEADRGLMPRDRHRSLDRPVKAAGGRFDRLPRRSEEHTSELQSLMRISYDVFCLKKTNK